MQNIYIRIISKSAHRTFRLSDLSYFIIVLSVANDGGWAPASDIYAKATDTNYNLWFGLAFGYSFNIMIGIFVKELIRGANF